MAVVHYDSSSIPHLFTYPNWRFLRYGIANRRLIHGPGKKKSLSALFLRHCASAVVVFYRQYSNRTRLPGET
jgi:hypothetical protein